MIRAFVIALALVLTPQLGCADDPTPLLRSQPGYPCGTAGKVCVVQKTCCGQDDVCGGEPDVVGCPAGSCCFDPSDGIGAKRTTKQTPQH